MSKRRLQPITWRLNRSIRGAAPVHAVQHQAVQVGVEVGRRAKALDQRDRAAVGLICLEPGLAEQMARDHAVHPLQHGRHQLGYSAVCSGRWRS